jgi:hypothetical protein
MYGSCEKGEVIPRLVSVVWLPKTWGKTLQITSVNGVDKHLTAVSKEIDALPQKIKQAAYPSAGTYNCRAVADTGEASPHSYGIAIDLNLAFSDYWFWRPHNGTIAYHNRMPQEIVEAFESQGETQEVRLRQLRAQGRDDTEDALELVTAHAPILG